VQAYVLFGLAAMHPSRDSPQAANLAAAAQQELGATMNADQLDKAKALFGILSER
jgi:hypothetical protein